jgi:hypothetical protein
MSSAEKHRSLDRRQQQSVEDSFPASDPPAHTGIVGPGSGREKEEPKGTPTADRYAAETAPMRRKRSRGEA